MMIFLSVVLTCVAVSVIGHESWVIRVSFLTDDLCPMTYANGWAGHYLKENHTSSWQSS